MPAKFPQKPVASTDTHSPQVPHTPPVPPVPFKKDEQEVRRKHDTPPPRHHDPEEEGVLGETDRPTPPSDKPESGGF